MAFETEEAMVAAAKDYLPEQIGTPGDLIFEFGYAAGRTDAVIVRRSPAYLERRIGELGVDQPIKNEAYLRCFLQIHSRSELTKDYYLELGGLPRRKKRSALDWLVDVGFVESNSDGKLRSAPYLRPHVTTAISIEFKLRRWERALQQAFQGKAFSQYQYVALDEERINPALDHLETFEKLNVGLASVDSGGALTLHHSPRKNRPFSPLNRWALNEETLTC